MSDPHYIIGIDLGTTNSALSYVNLTLENRIDAGIEIFKVPQLTGPGEVARLNFLPSFLYLPCEHDLPKDAISLPWEKSSPGFVGALAREQGAKIPNHMVSSAKSWLCHGRVDRKAPILPWGVVGDHPRVSPVEATAAYLGHFREAWNHTKAHDEEERIENQLVIVTVPASFDEVARDLTQEAADRAGFKGVILLEEPLAAFYAWLLHHEEDWERLVNPGELILVCDVGGGTTDFTLIALKEGHGKPTFERIAVGDHLILGGDNMDLALARGLEARLGKGKTRSISVNAWQGLCHLCRQAKEDILSERADARRITLVGEGRRLITDTVSALLERQEVEEVILEGFFPMIGPSENLEEEPRKGITEFGLPYAQDPAISRQMIRFLERHREDISEMLGRDRLLPDAILFNGGALKPRSVQDRLGAVLRNRYEESDGNMPRVLVNPDLDLAVAMGAAYYGLVRRGLGVRVISGSPRAYFLGVGHSGPEGIDADAPGIALCMVERGMEEGRKVELADRKFHVLTNQPVSFDLYSSSYRTGDRVGDIIDIDESLTPLPSIRTVIQFGKKAKKVDIPITVEAYYTEVGTLSIWCQALQTDHRWRLQFQLRDVDRPLSLDEGQVFEEAVVDQALSVVREVFQGRGKELPPERLVKTLCAVVEQRKERWPLGFLRRMTDQLLEVSDGRKLTPDHESRWLNQTGFCLRPGLGDALDEHRIKRVWKLHHEGPVHARAIQVRSEWWVFWRRVAAGLSTNQQQRLLQEISGYLSPKRSKGKKKLPPQEELEIWMALANLERIPPSDKAEFGRLLLSNIRNRNIKSQYWWALSRLGAREPLYGPLDRVAPVEAVSEWIEEILSLPWANPKPVVAALCQLARLTGDRKRDVLSPLLDRVLERLKTLGWAASQISALEEVLPRDTQEADQVFGESLPSGLLLQVSEKT